MDNNNNNVQGPPPAGPNFLAPNLRAMEELLQAPTDGVGDAIVVPPLLLFLFSLEGAARTWLEKELPNSITTWNDLVSKFVNQLFPPSRTTNLRNEITRFQQRFDETFSEVWDRFKDLLNKLPHHGFSHLYQIDMFYNGLSQSDQDSLNSATGGNLLTRNTQEALTIIKNKSKVRTSRNKPQVLSASGSSSQDAAIIVLTKQVEALGKHISSMNKPIHSIQDSCDSCGGPYSSYECQSINNIAYSGILAKALQERPQSALHSDTIPNPRGEIKAITTRSGIVLAGPLVPLPLLASSKESSSSSRSSKIPLSPSSPSELPKRNPHQPLIPYPWRLNKEKLQYKSDIQVHKFLQMFKKLHFNISLAEALALMLKYAKMIKDLLSDKEKLLRLANTSLTENCLEVLLKKLPEKLGDLRKFLIPYDFPELKKCMALADLGASINLMPLFLWKKMMLHELVPTRMTLELANRSVAYPAGRPFLRTASALVYVYGEELILRDGDEKLIFRADSTLKHPHKHGNDGSTTSPSDSFPSLTSYEISDSFLEEFANKHALLKPFPPRNEDDNFDPEADLREIEYLLNRNPSTDSSPKTDIDIIDPILERFIDELALVYSFLTGDDDDDLFDFNDSNHLEESFESFDIATLLSSPFRNEDKVFNPCILIFGGTQIFHDESKDKDLKMNSSTEALLILMENNFLSHSSDRELLFFLESTVIKTFLDENEDKVFNPGIPISK
ncbi:reverse transcriptase domain-containing protein [Tanacetum coccineum]